MRQDVKVEVLSTKSVGVEARVSGVVRRHVSERLDNYAVTGGHVFLEGLQNALILEAKDITVLFGLNLAQTFHGQARSAYYKGLTNVLLQASDFFPEAKVTDFNVKTDTILAIVMALIH